MPSDRFLLMGWFGIDLAKPAYRRGDRGRTSRARHVSTNLDVPMGFDSQSFPFGINGSYRATDKWTVNGGVAYYSDFIDPGRRLRRRRRSHALDATPYGLLQNQWGYASRASSSQSRQHL